MRPLRNSGQKEKVKRQKPSLLKSTSEDSALSFPYLFPFALLLLPSAFEKLPHQLAAFAFQDALDHFHSMIQLIGVTNVKVRFHGAGLFIGGAVNKQLHARLDQRTGAHRAGFKGRINGGVGQSEIAKLSGRLAQRHNLRVSRWIAICSREIY